MLAAVRLLIEFDLFLRQKAVCSFELSFEISQGTIGLGLSLRTQTPLLVLSTEKQRLHSVRNTEEHKRRQGVWHEENKCTCNSSTCPRYI